MHDEERVRQRAHEIWEKAERPGGQHDAHWEQACREIEAESAEPSPADTSNEPLKKAKGFQIRRPEARQRRPTKVAG